MATKYIVDNLSGQTITGNLTINGNLFVTGTSTNTLSTYKALLTQTGPITSSNMEGFNDAFIIGESYTIDIYVSGDNFSNIANVTSGVINETGCIFIATGSTPTNWDNGSTLISSGNLVVNVVENTLGYDIYWEKTPFGGNGYYFGFNDLVGPVQNAFPRNNTIVTCQAKYPFDYGGIAFISTYGSVVSPFDVDSVIEIDVLDLDIASQADNLLYYNPVQIDILQDMTPIVFSGYVDTSYPVNNVSVQLFCDGNNIDYYYGNTDNANNINELITILNSDPDTNVLGTYSDAGDGGVLLTMTTHNANLFCNNLLITFRVFND